MHFRFPFIAALTALSFFISSCILFSPTKAPKPVYETTGIALSEETFHSPNGDVVGYVPEGWFILDLEHQPPPVDALVALSNAKYEATLALAELTVSAVLKSNIEKDGIMILAEASFHEREKRTGSAARITKKFERFTIAAKEFVSYEYTTDGGATVSRVIVFRTAAHCYELAMISLPRSTARMVDIFSIEQAVAESLAW